MNILVVEDDTMSRMIMVELLSDYGTVDTAVNGEEALILFQSAHDRQLPYELICMDIMMPKVDGRQALREIRQAEKRMGLHGADGVKVLMISALNDSKNIIGSFKETCDGYLVKPVDHAKLIKLLRELELIHEED